MSNRIRQFLSVPKGILQDHQTDVRFLFESMDLAIIFLAYLLAAILTHATLDWPFLRGQMSDNLLNFTLAGMSFLLVANLVRLYRSWRWHSIAAEIATIWKAWVIVAGVLLLVAFNRNVIAGDNTRVLLHWLILTPLLFAFWRIGLRVVVHQLRAVGFNTRRVMVIGSGPEAVNLARAINSRKGDAGIRLLGLCDDQAQGQKAGSDADDIKRVADTQGLLEMARKRKLDIVYIALPMNREAEIRQLVDQLSDTTVSVHVLIPELLEPVLYNQTQTFGDQKTVSIYSTPFEDRLNEKVKRLEDIVLCSIFLLMAALPMAFIALIIRLSSGAPVIFKQTRYGLGGKGVEIWKFRSMTNCQSGADATQATRNDPRVTPFGAFLRKTSLDELPQLINVIQGHMSLVGPRPHPVNLNETYRKLIKFYMQRHCVKPGITGWAQVNGWRGETGTLDKMEKRLEHDLYYIRNWSISLDIKILLLTVFGGMVGKNAY